MDIAPPAVTADLTALLPPVAPAVVYDTYPSGYSNISTEVVIIGGQRYHPAPGWRPRHEWNDRYPDRYPPGYRRPDFEYRR